MTLLLRSPRRRPQLQLASPSECADKARILVGTDNPECVRAYVGESRCAPLTTLVLIALATLPGELACRKKNVNRPSPAKKMRKA
mgnify:CR=1 FL=1